MPQLTVDNTIRPARAEDLADLADLAARAFRDAFGAENEEHDMEEYLSTSMSVKTLEKDFADEKNIFRVACSHQAGNLVGYAKLRDKSDYSATDGNSAIEIERIYADSSMIGTGIGKALMTECLSLAKSLGRDVIWLGVWDQNDRAIKFYERWGFSIVGEREFKLGSDIQNDLIMRKELTSHPEGR